MTTKSRFDPGSVVLMVVAIAFVLGICFVADSLIVHITALFASPTAPGYGDARPARSSPGSARGTNSQEGWQR